MAARRMLLWEGVSRLDGTTPILVVATYDDRAPSSRNSKTGDMVQTWILRADIEPHEVLKQGLDGAICGACPHRSVAAGGSGACYVAVHQAPLSIFRAHQRNGSLPFDVEAFRGRKVRVGSYGDPAAAPLELWQSIVDVASGVTGYTHQWRTCDKGFSQFCMASVDTPSDGPVAKSMGYRSFIVRGKGSPKPVGAVVCPASVEAGKRTVCARCLQCGGMGSGRKNDVTIIAHGVMASKFMEGEAK